MVERLEALVKGSELHNVELFIFTDNTTVEYAHYKGNLSSPRLFDLVMRLHNLSFGGDIRLHVIHIAGTRMIECGIDGLSRGLMNKGVMQGRSLLELQKTALEQSPKLLEWVQS